MPKTQIHRNSHAALLAAIAAAYPIAGYSAPAARVDFAVGNVTAVNAGGQSRTLAKGAPLDEGETINTNNGRAQLRFTDGAYVSLQPESQFRIDQYRFDGKADGSEKGLFSLLKGGLRTITGLVGRSNRKNYQISTTLATIGIRGTEYTIQYGKSVSGTVGEGQIDVCNGAGCLSVTNGESYYVQNQEIKPVLSNKKTDLPPPSPQNPPPTFAVGETVDQNGDPCVLVPAQCGGLLTGTFTANVGAVTSTPVVVSPTTATLDGSGFLTQFDKSGTVVILTGPYADTGNNGVIAWGRATSATGGAFDPGVPLHYVIGTPTPAGDLTALGGMKASYALVGATQPTGLSDGQPIGSLTSAKLDIDFQRTTVGITTTWDLTKGGGPSSFRADVNGGLSGSAFTAIASTSSGSVNVAGFVAGANAAHAGAVINVRNSSVPQGGFIGAAAFKQTTLAPAQ